MIERFLKQEGTENSTIHKRISSSSFTYLSRQSRKRRMNDNLSTISFGLGNGEAGCELQKERGDFTLNNNVIDRRIQLFSTNANAQNHKRLFETRSMNSTSDLPIRRNRRCHQQTRKGSCFVSEFQQSTSDKGRSMGKVPRIAQLQLEEAELMNDFRPKSGITITSFIRSFLANNLTSLAAPPNQRRLTAVAAPITNALNHLFYFYKWPPRRHLFNALGSLVFQQKLLSAPQSIDSEIKISSEKEKEVDREKVKKKRIEIREEEYSERDRGRERERERERKRVQMMI
ncbi:DgyrCDS5884 [Dimorphilus gyrociliatus]|uniref:DgyrCDS5884 n=1 Tax=Dimorphilus gyrociliatus TaxID=2664684 RepID=A0A7I8VLA3_9ANNE|nr:DgyrCDS5884 [Dimorphilus gyrociliatus]